MTAPPPTTAPTNGVTISPTLCFPGIDYKIFNRKYATGCYSKLTKLPRGVKITGSTASMAKSHGTSLEDPSCAIRDKNGMITVVATTNHPQFEIYKLGDGKIEAGGFCRNCLKQFTHMGIGVIYSMQELTTYYIPSIDPPGFWTYQEYTQRGTGVATSTPRGPSCIPPKMCKKDFVHGADPSIPVQGKSEKKYVIWTGDPLCSFNCNLTYIRRLLSSYSHKGDLTYAESEKLLFFVFKLMYPDDDAILVPAPNPELYSPFSPKSALTKEEYESKKYLYVPSSIVLTVPAKVPHRRYDA